jgi:hypothetical protein
MDQVRPIFRTEAFDPETLQVLAQSYENAIDILKGTGEIERLSGSMPERLAQRIVMLGQCGERNITRLTIEALKFIRGYPERLSDDYPLRTE